MNKCENLEIIKFIISEYERGRLTLARAKNEIKNQCGNDEIKNQCGNDENN